MMGPAGDTSDVVSGYARTAASSENSLDYTFQILGNGYGPVAVRYATHARIDAPVAYEIEFVDDTTGALVGAPDWVDANADGEEDWNPVSSGIYSLIISDNTYVSASEDLGADSSAWFEGVFQVSIATIPESPTWAMMLIGIATVVRARGEVREGSGRQRGVDPPADGHRYRTLAKPRPSLGQGR